MGCRLWLAIGCRFQKVQSEMRRVTMRVEIDFSIYCSPTKAYGRAYGPWDVDPGISAGRLIEIPSAQLALQVVSIDVTDPHMTSISLSDVVLDALAPAAALSRRLESECGLFVDVYE
ncbi:hypothetical protein CDL60_18950 [Roseateles noduli]|nr:hypothetical protein CDL60_18950 [Roseateles noduli]